MGKKSKQMTIEQYVESGKHEALTYPAITKRLREGRALPNVKKFVKFGTVWALYVNVD